MEKISEEGRVGYGEDEDWGKTLGTLPEDEVNGSQYMLMRTHEGREVEGVG